MVLSAEQTLAIHQVLSLHGHLADSREYERFDEVYTDDVVCDMAGIGAGTVAGREALRQMAMDLGDGHPVGHHVTNVFVTPGDDGEARARSKGIGIAADGTSGSVVYEDLLRLTPGGWRIAYRRILPGRAPVGQR